MSHYLNQKLINAVNGNWMAFAADQEARYRKAFLDIEEDQSCSTCKKNTELVDGLCWECIMKLEEGEK